MVGYGVPATFMGQTHFGRGERLKADDSMLIIRQWRNRKLDHYRVVRQDLMAPEENP